MNKPEFVKAIAEKTGFTQKDTELFVGAFFDVVQETLSTGEDVNLVGKAKFEVVETKARTGRNPKDNTPINIPESVRAKVKLASPIKKAIKEALIK